MTYGVSVKTSKNSNTINTFVQKMANESNRDEDVIEGIYFRRCVIANIKIGRHQPWSVTNANLIR